jgi:phage shock protein A
MLQRVNEETAKNEARMEMALDSVDTDSIKLEEEAEKLRAQELVNQFKLEMGMEGGGRNVESTTNTNTNPDLNKTT